MPTLNASPHRRGPWFLLLALALMVNALLFLLLEGVLRGQKGGPMVSQASSRVQVSLVDESPPEEEKKNKKKLNEQIVRNDALVKEKAPKDAKRRSEFDNTVERETRAPNGRPGARPVRPSKQVAKQVQPRQARAGQRGAQGQSNKAGKSQTSAQRPAQRPSRAKTEPGSLVRLDNLGRLAAATRPSQAQAESADSAAARAGKGGRELRFTDRQRMAQLFGRPGTMQDLRDVQEGDKTLLNTKRSRYASFFNRVRDAIAKHWHPGVLHSAHDPHGKIYGTKDRTTKVIIVLRADGSVARVRTTGACGVDYLDEEAVRSIWAAQPFANPPKDLVDPMTGRIEFGFAFTLEFGGRSRIFRMRQ